MDAARNVDTLPGRPGPSGAPCAPLARQIEQGLRDGSLELPVIDDVAMQLERTVREDHLEVEGIVALLERDPAFGVEVLRIANTPLFLALNEVRSLRDAVVRLGVRQIALIVFGVEQKRLYSAAAEPYRARLNALWRHVFCTAHAARWIARRLRLVQIADDAYVAGLIHEVGALGVLRALEERDRRESAPPPDPAAVDAILGQLGCAVGRQIVERWGLPTMFGQIIEAMTSPYSERLDPMQTILRLADLATIVHEEAASTEEFTATLLALPEADALAFDDDDAEALREHLVDVLASA